MTQGLQSHTTTLVCIQLSYLLNILGNFRNFFLASVFSSVEGGSRENLLHKVYPGLGEMRQAKDLAGSPAGVKSFACPIFRLPPAEASKSYLCVWSGFISVWYSVG